MLHKVEARGALDVTKRIRQSVGAVFRFGIASGNCKRNPAAEIQGALMTPPRAKHMATLKPTELGTFFSQLRRYDGEKQTSLALELVAHTFVRTSELRFATWSELEPGIWRIPEARMKMHREHLVPLSQMSIRILEELRSIAGASPWILPGLRNNPMSANTMIFALYRMGYHSRATVHGFRGLASTVLNESGLWRPDAIERQLAHVSGNKVRSAYNAAEYLDERARMMQWWSDYLAQKSGDLSDLLA